MLFVGTTSTSSVKKKWVMVEPTITPKIRIEKYKRYFILNER